MSGDIEAERDRLWETHREHIAKQVGRMLEYGPWSTDDVCSMIRNLPTPKNETCR